MKSSLRNNSIEKSTIKVWKPLLEPNLKQNNSQIKKKIDITQIESPRHNDLDSFNIYSALEDDRLLEAPQILPTIDTIFKKFNYINPQSSAFESIEIKKKSLKKLSNIHLTDPNLASEKSFIEKSKKKLNSKKSRKASRKQTRVKKSKTPSHNKNTPPQTSSNVTETLPSIENIYQNQRGLLSRKNSFISENLNRLKNESKPFCESIKEHYQHTKSINKLCDSRCMFCMKRVGTLAPENTFIGLPTLESTSQLEILTNDESQLNFINDEIEKNNNTNLRDSYNNLTGGLLPTNPPRKSFFCDILGEKYCLGCIECHERRFAKIYENKYMTQSDPMMVTINLLINQRISSQLEDIKLPIIKNKST